MKLKIFLMSAASVGVITLSWMSYAENMDQAKLDAHYKKAYDKCVVAADEGANEQENYDEVWDNVFQDCMGKEGYPVTEEQESTLEPVHEPRSNAAGDIEADKAE